MRFFNIILFFFLLGCNPKNENNKVHIIESIGLIKSKSEDLKEKENWYFKDVIKDTIPGISLNKSLNYLKNQKIRDTIIIAVIDRPIDLNHKDLKNHIWINKNEIPSNNIDDDGNGYIDDINGWNFKGTEDGKQIEYVQNESTRIIRKFDERFKNDSTGITGREDSLNYALYKEAKSIYQAQNKTLKKDIAYIKMLDSLRQATKNSLSKYIPNQDFTIENLDSLKNVRPGDVLLQDDIIRMTNFLKYEITDEYIKNYKLINDKTASILLNTDFNDRQLLGDNPEDIEDKTYGNNILNTNVENATHAIRVAGVIIGVGDKHTFLNKSIKIMPIVTSAEGEVHDKDLALGIRYAVDNGAKVINMSFSKQLSMHKDWVKDAYQYASKNDVLIISSAGNEAENLDENNNYYPNDTDIKGIEITDNFLLIGASTYTADESLLAQFTNYGNRDVDIFAPGYEIKTMVPNNTYKIDSGTSLSAALVSKVAALIWSYYPNLKASEVKQILMKSGTAYYIDVEVRQKDGSKKLIPFSSLSKSGKILNAYNALKMAELVSKF